MSLMETGQLLGNFGEFVSSIAVLATLAYLAIQVRQNAGASRVAAGQSVLTALNSSLIAAASTPEFSHTILDGQIDFKSLSEGEQKQFVVFMLAWFRGLEQAHLAYRLGQISDGEWGGHAAHISGLMKSEGVQRWWQTRRAVFSPEFQDFVDSSAKMEAAMSVNEQWQHMQSLPS